MYPKNIVGSEGCVYAPRAGMVSSQIPWGDNAQLAVYLVFCMLMHLVDVMKMSGYVFFKCEACRGGLAWKLINEYGNVSQRFWLSSYLISANMTPLNRVRCSGHLHVKNAENILFYTRIWMSVLSFSRQWLHFQWDLRLHLQHIAAVALCSDFCRWRQSRTGASKHFQ